LTFQMDTAGMLWCAMPDKLVRLNTRTGERAYFPYSHDLRSRSLFCMTLMPDNQLVFLSRDYIFLFDPATAGIPYPLPRPYITGIDIREQPLQTDTVIRHLSELHLAPHENFFSISFSALGLSLDRNHLFRYRMRGFQDEWIDVTDQRPANFTNVPSGRYVFELQLTDTLSGQTGASCELPVQIRRRWTELTWVR